jgi:hypothetical protein
MSIDTHDCDHNNTWRMLAAQNALFTLATHLSGDRTLQFHALSPNILLDTGPPALRALATATVPSLAASSLSTASSPASSSISSATSASRSTSAAATPTSQAQAQTQAQTQVQTQAQVRDQLVGLIAASSNTSLGGWPTFDRLMTDTNAPAHDSMRPAVPAWPDQRSNHSADATAMDTPPSTIGPAARHVLGDLDRHFAQHVVVSHSRPIVEPEDAASLAWKFVPLPTRRFDAKKANRITVTGKSPRFSM